MDHSYREFSDDAAALQDADLAISCDGESSESDEMW